MKKYWQSVLFEVLNRDNESTEFCYTSLGEIRTRANEIKRDYSKPKKSIKIYAVGEPYKGVYFTQRESQCMEYFLQGMTIAKAAEHMELSPRTVEFYVKNMKMKLDCNSKDELIDKVANTDFLANFLASEK